MVMFIFRAIFLIALFIFFESILYLVFSIGWWVFSGNKFKRTTTCVKVAMKDFFGRDLDG